MRFFNRKSHLPELIKSVTVYVSDKYKHLIIASRSQNDAGIVYEQGKCSTMMMPTDMEELGNLVVEHFNQYSVRDVNLRDHKASDWPAYKYGKSESIRAFEQDYIRISVDGANEKNIIFIFRGLPFKGCELTVNTSISYYAEKHEIGQRLLSVYEACLTGRVF